MSSKGIMSFFKPVNNDSTNCGNNMVIIEENQEVTIQFSTEEQPGLEGNGKGRKVEDQPGLEENGKRRKVENGKGKKRKRQAGQWTQGRDFQEDWARRFPCIGPIIEEDEFGFPRASRARCDACSWKQGTNIDMQLKLDTIEKHAGKVYGKEMEDGKEVRVVRWKTKEECRHLQNVEEYMEFLSKKELAVAKPIKDLLQKVADKTLQARLVQLQAVFHVLKKGRPMTDYPKEKEILEMQRCQNFPISHWSKQSGWEFAKCIDEVLRQDLQEDLRNCEYFAVSLDEATAKDNSSWLCMTVYFVTHFVRRASYVRITRLLKNATAENIYGTVEESLKTVMGLSAIDIAKKLVCNGLDGCSVMQGCRNGLSVKMQTALAPYALGVHCMAHRMNLAYKIVDNFASVTKIEDLIKNTYNFFCRSSKRFCKFQKMAAGLTKGNKMLNTVSTRWISLYKPAQRLFLEYPSLVGLMDKLSSKSGQDSEKPLQLLAQLVDLETLLTLAGILPMLREMNFLIKLAQKRTMYISEYVQARQMACLTLDFMYPTSGPYDKEKFGLWNNLLDVDGDKSILEFDAKDTLCMKVHSHLVQMYAPKTRIRGRLLRRAPVTKDTFAEIVIVVRKNLHDIAGALAKEIRDRFPRDDLLDAMCIVYPQFWITTRDEHHKRLKQIDFKSKVRILKDHFSKTVTVGSEIICNAIDGNALMEQSQCFGETMWAQCAELEEPKEFGSITRLWLFISNSQFLQDRMPEYFRLVRLCQTMILGSVEDERAFSIMNYLKNKVRNRLTNNLDIALRSYTCKYTLKDFPFERALALWDSTSRRESQAVPDVIISSGHLNSSSGWSAFD